jgi:LPXTG-motif cell wall-anchored protein
VSLELDLTDTEISTVGTTTKQTIAKIEGGEDAVFSFSILADPEAQSGVVRVPLTITFTATDGEEIVQSETTGILVHSNPEVSVLLDRVSRSADGKEVAVLLRVVNKGLSQIKFAEIEVQDTDGYDVGSGRRSAYVGNIDSDDFQTAEFSVVPKGDTFELKANLKYSDALNKAYDVPVTIEVNAPPASGSSGASKLIWIAVAIVVVGGIFLWRRRSKKERR